MVVWFFFIEYFNGKVFFLFGLLFILKILYLFIDVSNVGFGCVFSIKWFFGFFDISWLEYYIFVCEFFLIILVVEIWGLLLINIFIVFYLDNIVVVYVINKLIFKDLNLMKFMRCFMVIFFKYNISFYVEYILGLFNNVVDFLFCL